MDTGSAGAFRLVSNTGRMPLVPSLPRPATPNVVTPVEPPIPGGRERVVLERVSPSVDGGRFPIKRTVGELVRVRADAFSDGHDLVTCSILHRHEDDDTWLEVPMEALGNDVFGGEFRVARLGRHQYTVHAWLDRFASWQRDLAKRIDAGQEISVDLEIGTRLVEAAAAGATAEDQRALETLAARLADPKTGGPHALEPAHRVLMRRTAPRDFSVELPAPLEVTVDRERARFSTWYELFPRSASDSLARHGTFADVEARSPTSRRWASTCSTCRRSTRSAATHRKGPNNTPEASRGRPRQPLGDRRGRGRAHGDPPRARHVRRLRPPRRGGAPARGIEIALDLAFQCSPDHPWVSEHPEWFRHRPDGSIQYAENPPKHYQDIYPLDFECEDWPALWEALLEVVRFWIGQGVRIFRVDNPHTKPFAFWEWLIAEVVARAPRHDLPGRGLHPPEGHGPPRQARLHPVLHLLHLAQHQRTSCASTCAS